MATEAPAPRNTNGMLLLTAVILLDAALLVWVWHWLQNRDSGSGVRSSAGAASTERARLPVVPVAPELPATGSGDPADVSEGAAAGAPSHAAGAGALPLVVREPLGPSSGRADPEARAHIGAAVARYRALKRQERYRNSPVLKAWSREFLAYEDLRAINHQYWKDQDALAFVIATFRSPNFGRLLARFIGRPELQAFVRDMAAAPAVAASTRLVLEDPKVMAAVKDVTIPGLPPLGKLMATPNGARR